MAPDEDTNWASNDGWHRRGVDTAGNPINGTPRAANSTTLPPHVLMSEVAYSALTAHTSGDEFVELCNAQPGGISLSGLKIGDEEEPGGSEGMYLLPEGWWLEPDTCIVIAKNAAQFADRFGFLPDCEFIAGAGDYPDTPSVPNLVQYRSWAHGDWALADDGDEVLLLSKDDQVVDSVAYASGNYTAANVTPSVRSGQGQSLQRVWPVDTDKMAADFLAGAANPGSVTPLPVLPDDPPPPAQLADGMRAYWGLLVSHSSYSSGTMPPVYAFATARSLGLHFLAITDHVQDLSAAEWQDLERSALAASTEDQFVGLRGFEDRSLGTTDLWIWNSTDVYASSTADVPLSDHRNWLSMHPEAVAGLAANDPIGGFSIPAPELINEEGLCLWRALGEAVASGVFDPQETWWMKLLGSGWMVAPMGGAPGADELVTGDALRTGIVAPALTRGDLVEAIRQRRVFVSQRSTVALTLRQGDDWMGSLVEPGPNKVLTVNLHDTRWDGGAVAITLYDGAAPVAATELVSPSAEWTVVISMEAGHRYWARAVRSDGGVAMTAPIWVQGVSRPEPVVINEILPAPRAVDWDGNGVMDTNDEWVELYNNGDTPVGLGGWLLQEQGGAAYLLPLGFVAPAHGFGLVWRSSSRLPFNNDGDAVSLIRPDGAVADRFVYDRSPGYDTAWCRLPDGLGGGTTRCAPTPGGNNCPAPVASPRQVSIHDARRLPRGSWVQLRGHVTVVPGILSDRVMYLQDSSSGTRVYLPKDHGLNLTEGERIEVTGRVRNYHGEMQISVTARQDVRSVGKFEPVLPMAITTGSLLEPYEGMLVRLDGMVVDVQSSAALWLDDGTGWARVYMDPDAPIEHPLLDIDLPLGVVGVVSQYEDTDSGHPGYRLLPRRTADLVVSVAENRLYPTMLPETGQ